ncbi:acyltransferase [Microbispora sp. GKU 823]|uniref:acyltransferase family protein n=1 Tax=Microbispora sp. GKU 823 TaxID=1652100 RepID=UPI0009A45B56|nr:acyltransferase [Microbispora sp. GKU 823]
MTSSAQPANSPPAAPAPPPSRLPTLTGMRFIAAALVFLFHATVQQLFAEPGAQKTFSAVFTQGGWAGVGFFFVLSGFVLAWSYRPGQPARRFWRRRLVKIYPNHLVTMVVAFVLLTLVSKVAVDHWHALYNLLLVQSWFPQLEIRGSLNGVTWSLSCELLFYLAFPLLMRPLSRIRPERLWAWAAGVAVAIFLVPVASSLLPRQPVLPMVEIPAYDFWIIYQFPPVRMLDFVFGIILARIVMTGRRLPLGLGGAAVLAVAAYAVAPLFPTTYTLTAVMVVPLGLLVAAGAAADVAGRRTGLSGRLWIRLGEISFAFYLWQQMVLTYGHLWLGPGKSWSTPVAAGVLVLLFGVVLALSWALFTLVEQPLMRRFASPRRRPAPPAVPADLPARN